MLFNSIHFLVFFPLVTVAYFMLPLRPRRVLLLAASFYFYCVFSISLSLLLVFSTVLDYTVARVIDASRRSGVRKVALAASLVGNLGVLCTFKYLDFFNNSFALLFGEHAWPVLNLVLPMGISFYTFQTMAYTIDVYRGKLRAQRSILDVALYVSFFPQLVAGPIMRGSSLLPQFREYHEPNTERILSGVLLMVWGLLKKVFVADPLGIIVDSVFGTHFDPVSPAQFSWVSLLVAGYAFSIQIYCDFSAYSDIAIGAGRVLGFRLMKNFDSPYLSTSMREMWHRWHISLSTWLRDYLYIPLGGGRCSKPRAYFNLALTMLLGGLWHGANWTFVVWGGLHGLFLVVERFFGIDKLDRSKMGVVEKWVRGIITFHLWSLAFTVFRCGTVQQAFEIFARIFTLADGEQITFVPIWVLAGLLAVQICKGRIDFGSLMLRHPNVARFGVYACLAVLVVALAGGRTPEFIYFQF